MECDTCLETGWGYQENSQMWEQESDSRAQRAVTLQTSRFVLCSPSSGIRARGGPGYIHSPLDKALLKTGSVTCLTGCNPP